MLSDFPSVITTDLNGAALSTPLYKPLRQAQDAAWGGRKCHFRVRSQSGTLPTEYTFTGQRSHVDEFGLLFYVARWYDPLLGRFAQADTIVPGAGNPMAFDRYSYVQNNPLHYIDPSGHLLCSEMPWEEGCTNTEEQIYRTLVRRGETPKFTRLPVDAEDIDWIQWFGGTETAYQDHLAYEAGKPNNNYDGYCQGYHCGLDLGAEWDTPIYAGVYGDVIKVGTGSSGLMVVVEIGDYQIQYEHLANAIVEAGQSISPDTIIGGVGNQAGIETNGNIHLHFEIRFSSTGNSPYKDRISNPLSHMNTSLFSDLSAIAEQQGGNNVTFHGPIKNPLQQPSPIIRGGTVLW